MSIKRKHNTLANHARATASRSVCNRRVSWPPSLSLGRWHMASRVAIGIAGAIALGLCFLSMRDVPHNSAIRNSQQTMTILGALVVLIIVAGLLALLRNSRMTAIASFVASGLGILFSLVLACV